MDTLFEGSELLEPLRDSLNGHETIIETEHSFTDTSESIPLRAIFSPILDEHGLVFAGIGILEDETERRRARDIELEAQQLKVAGQLAATIAHEFNNPLAVIQAKADLIQMRGLMKEDQNTLADQIKRQVDRMHNLVQKLLMLRKIKEVDYVSGMKMLDIHTPDEEKNDPS
jgi:signal transduction histidine kinase